MQKITFKTGVKSYEINGNGVLRFNPNDPNVYARFLDAVQEITDLEEKFAKKASAIDTSDEKTSGEEFLRFMADADKEIKKILSEVFGEENDFNKLLGGVNVLAVAENGERVITNLFQALTPILQSGAENCATQQINDAKAARAQRKANEH